MSNIMLLFIVIILFNIQNSQQQNCYEDLNPDLNLTLPDSQGNTNLPKCPVDIDLQFLIFTCNSRVNPQIIKWDFIDNDIQNSIIINNTVTKFITHGGETDFYSWSKVMKDYILDKFCNVMQQNVNVIGVNWPKGAAVFSQQWGALSYFQEAANIKVVAALIAKLVRKLQVLKGIGRNQIELIGHSWGTIASGQAGRLINPKIDRITGMDPSSLGFLGPDKELKLDFSDALWTNCIHTNGVNPNGIITEGGLGIAGNYEALCSVDFYINGGSQQPGCPPAPDFCSHNRVTELTDVNVPNNCQFIAYKADSYLNNFLKGNFDDCNSVSTNCRPLPLAFDYWENTANKNPIGLPFPNKYYMQTRDVFPFCQFHFQIKLWKTKKLFFSDRCDLIELNFSGQRVGVGQMYESNGFCTALLVSDTDFTLVNSVSVQTYATGADQNAFTVTRIEINYLSHINSGYRLGRSAKFCTSREVGFYTQPQVITTLCP